MNTFGRVSGSPQASARLKLPLFSCLLSTYLISSLLEIPLLLYIECMVIIFFQNSHISVNNPLHALVTMCYCQNIKIKKICYRKISPYRLHFEFLNEDIFETKFLFRAQVSLLSDLNINYHITLV